MENNRETLDTLDTLDSLGVQMILSRFSFATNETAEDSPLVGEPQKSEGIPLEVIQQSRDSDFGQKDHSCRRCKTDRVCDCLIHAGQSVRRDCAICGRFHSFPLWHGRLQSIPFGEPWEEGKAERVIRLVADSVGDVSSWVESIEQAVNQQSWEALNTTLSSCWLSLLATKPEAMYDH